MAYAKNMMGLGVAAAEAAGDFIAVVATGLTAAGTTQGTALAINADANLVSSAASLSGVIIYNGVIGDSTVVYNDNTGNTFIVYPPVGSKINNGATNAGVNLAPNTTMFLMKVTATRWIAILSA